MRTKNELECEANLKAQSSRNGYKIHETLSHSQSLSQEKQTMVKIFEIQVE